MFARYGDTRRMDYMRLNPMRTKPARQPEAVPTSFEGQCNPRDLAAGLDRLVAVAERGVDPLEGWRARGGRPAARLDGLVGASGIGHAGEAGQAIADHLTRSIEVTFGEPRQGVAGKTTDTAQFHADRLAIRGRLHRGDEGRLPRRPAPSLTTGAFAAKV